MQIIHKIHVVHFVPKSLYLLPHKTICTVIKKTNNNTYIIVFTKTEANMPCIYINSHKGHGNSKSCAFVQKHYMIMIYNGLMYKAID